MTDTASVDGLVLCRVGGERVAVPAGDVVSIDEARPTLVYAGLSFGQGRRAPEGARALVHETGAVVVDSVEVAADRYPLLPAPALTRALCGGALAGFVEAADALWPVLSLPRFTEALGRL